MLLSAKRDPAAAMQRELAERAETASVRCAWIVVDMQRGFDTPDLRALAGRIRDKVHAQPGPVWALVQVNPADGPLRLLRDWEGCSEDTDAYLLEPIRELSPSVVLKKGYGARAELPLTALTQFEAVFVVGADTDACVLATALGLFDAGIRVVIRAELCMSSAGPLLHAAGMQVLVRQLGAARVLLEDEPIDVGLWSDTRE